MKLVKMRNRDIDEFDTFLQSKLESFDVDQDKADLFMSSMQFPVKPEEQPSRKRFFISFGIVAILLLAITGSIYNFNSDNKKKEINNIQTIEQITTEPVHGGKENLDATQKNKTTYLPVSTSEDKTGINTYTKKNQQTQSNSSNSKPELLNKKEEPEIVKTNNIVKDSLLVKIKSITNTPKKDTINIIW